MKWGHLVKLETSHLVKEGHSRKPGMPSEIEMGKVWWPSGDRLFRDSSKAVRRRAL